MINPMECAQWKVTTVVVLVVGIVLGLVKLTKQRKGAESTLEEKET